MTKRPMSFDELPLVLTAWFLMVPPSAVYAHMRSGQLIKCQDREAVPGPEARTFAVSWPRPANAGGPLSRPYHKQEENTMSELSQNIYRTGRICTVLTQEEAVEQIGVAAETLRTYEAGRRIFPPR